MLISKAHILLSISVLALGEFTLKWPNRQHSGQWVNIFQTELMVEIYSKTLVKAIGKVLLVKLS